MYSLLKRRFSQWEPAVPLDPASSSSAPTYLKKIDFSINSKQADDSLQYFKSLPIRHNRNVHEQRHEHFPWQCKSLLCELQHLEHWLFSPNKRREYFFLKKMAITYSFSKAYGLSFDNRGLGLTRILKVAFVNRLAFFKLGFVQILVVLLVSKAKRMRHFVNRNTDLKVNAFAIAEINLVWAPTESPTVNQFEK